MSGIGIGLSLPFYQFLGAQGAGGPPPFIETDAAAWFKPDGIVESGGSVTGWTDATANNNDMSVNVSSVGTITLSTLEGLPAVNLPQDAGMISSLSQGNISSPTEIFCVSRHDTPQTGSILGMVAGGTSAGRLELFTNTAGNIRAFSGALDLWSFGNLRDGSTAISYIVSDGADSYAGELDTNGYSTSGTSDIGSGGMSEVQLGSLSGSSGSAIGLYSEIIIFPRKLTSLERNQVLIYLANKYGLPAPLV